MYTSANTCKNSSLTVDACEMSRDAIVTMEINLLPYTQSYVVTQKKEEEVERQLEETKREIKRLQQEYGRLKKDKSVLELERCIPFSYSHAYLHSCSVYGCNGFVQGITHECELCHNTCVMPCTTLVQEIEKIEIPSSTSLSMPVIKDKVLQARIHSIQKIYPRISSYTPHRYMNQRISYLRGDISKEEMIASIKKTYDTYQKQDQYKSLLTRYLQFVHTHYPDDTFSELEEEERQTINKKIVTLGFECI